MEEILNKIRGAKITGFRFPDRMAEPIFVVYTDKGELKIKVDNLGFFWISFETYTQERKPPLE